MTEHELTAQEVITEVHRLSEEFGLFEPKKAISNYSLYRGEEPRIGEYPLVAYSGDHLEQGDIPEHVFLGVSDESFLGQERRIVTASARSGHQPTVKMYARKGDMGENTPLPLTRDEFDRTLTIAREHLSQRRTGPTRSTS